MTGMQGTLVIPLAGGKELVRQGLRVQHADSRLELDGKYTVWIEIANEVEADAAGIERWILRPGMHGRLTITTN